MITNITFSCFYSSWYDLIQGYQCYREEERERERIKFFIEAWDRRFEMLIASETSSVYHLSPPLRLYFSFKDVLRKLVKCKVQCLVGTVCPTFLRGAINDRPGVRVTWPRRGEFAQCITNQPPRPPPSSTLLLPRLSTRSPVYPPTASVILSCALPSTPRNTRPSQPSRILVPHSSLFIHPSCTPSTPLAPPQSSFARRHHHVSLYSPPRRHAGSTKRDCCYVALGDQQVSPSSSSSKTKAALRRSLSHRLLAPLSLSLSLVAQFRFNRFGKWKCYSIDGIFAFFTFDDAQWLGSSRNNTRELMTMWIGSSFLHWQMRGLVLEFFSLGERNEEIRSISLRLFNDRLILIEPRFFLASIALHSFFFTFKKIKFLLLRYIWSSLSVHFSIVIRFRLRASSNINYVIASVIIFYHSAISPKLRVCICIIHFHYSVIRVTTHAQ